jgi:Spy/CpxP family protein refolding chaperone
MHARVISCGPEASGHRCGCGGHERSDWHRARREARYFADPGPGGGFGVRRPLRFLAWKLELREEQVTQLATILNALKTERAQNDVDDRRALAMLADAVAAEGFDATKAGEAAKLREQSAARLEREVVEAVGKIHALLDPEQRERFAYLLRTGTVMM